MVQPPTRWFIGFCDVDLPRPWRWLTRPGFRHVWACYYVPERECWMFIEWSAYRLYIEIIDGEQVDALIAANRQRGTLVEVGVENNPKRVNWPFAPIYCVTLLTQLIGLRGFIVTPYQLFRALQKAGATVIFEPDGK